MCRALFSPPPAKRRGGSASIAQRWSRGAFAWQAVRSHYSSRDQKAAGQRQPHCKGGIIAMTSARANRSLSASIPPHRIAIAIAAALACNLGALPASAADFVMKFGTATINETHHQFIKFYKDEVEKASNGRIEVQIYPASQLGPIPREIEGVQLGNIQGLYRTGRLFCRRRSALRRVLRADAVPRRA